MPVAFDVTKYVNVIVLTFTLSVNCLRILVKKISFMYTYTCLFRRHFLKKNNILTL